MKPKGLAIGAALLVPAMFLRYGLCSVVLLLGTQSRLRPIAAPQFPSRSAPTPQIDGYQDEQLKNAALVINAGKARACRPKGQMIGVMVALGESGLAVLDHGDGPGPDSRGLFQQRDNGAWGSYADRMDPASATNFSRALQTVKGWELLDRRWRHTGSTQRGSVHYQPYWDPAAKSSGRCQTTKFSLSGEVLRSPANPARATICPGPSPQIYQPTPLGMYNRECVDFALWRVNQQLGSATAPFKVQNSTFRPDGVVLGSALSWKDGWDAKGWPTG